MKAQQAVRLAWQHHTIVPAFNIPYSVSYTHLQKESLCAVFYDSGRSIFRADMTLPYRWVHFSPKRRKSSVFRFGAAAVSNSG